MDIVENRKYPRVKINSLVSYVCLSEEGNPVAQMMGSAVDISQGGLLLKTDREIEPGIAILLMTTDEKDRLVEVRGTVAHCRNNDSGKFNVGITFQGTQAENIQFAKSIVRANYYRRRPSQLNKSIPV